MNAAPPVTAEGLAWLEGRVSTLLSAYVAAMDAVTANLTELTCQPYPSPRYAELAASTGDLKAAMARAGEDYRAADAELKAARAEYQAGRG